MSSFSGKIKLTGKTQGDIGEFGLRSLTCSTSSPRDKITGRPSGRIFLSDIDVDIDIEPKAVNILNAIYTTEELTADISFDDVDDKSKYLEIKLKSSYCTSIEQVFSSLESGAFTVHLRLSVVSIETTATDGGVTASYSNPYEKTAAGNDQ